MNKIRKGDEVVVITGKDKGRRGTVLQVFDDQRVLVEGREPMSRRNTRNRTRTWAFKAVSSTAKCRSTSRT
jgi:large subunit ribosomal protein L24